MVKRQALESKIMVEGSFSYLLQRSLLDVFPARFVVPGLCLVSFFLSDLFVNSKKESSDFSDLHVLRRDLDLLASDLVRNSPSRLLQADLGENSLGLAFRAASFNGLLRPFLTSSMN